MSLWAEKQTELKALAPEVLAETYKNHRAKWLINGPSGEYVPRKTGDPKAIAVACSCGLMSPETPYLERLKEWIITHRLQVATGVPQEQWGNVDVAVLWDRKPRTPKAVPADAVVPQEADAVPTEAPVPAEAVPA